MKSIYFKGRVGFKTSKKDEQIKKGEKHDISGEERHPFFVK